MPTFSAAYTTAGNPYNVLNVVSGVQTTGVTPRTGVTARPAAPRNCSRLEISCDDEVAGTIRVASGPPASITNLVGKELAVNTSIIFESKDKMGQYSLADKSFAVSADGMIVHIDYE